MLSRSPPLPLPLRAPPHSLLQSLPHPLLPPLPPSPCARSLVPDPTLHRHKMSLYSVKKSKETEVKSQGARGRKERSARHKCHDALCQPRLHTRAQKWSAERGPISHPAHSRLHQEPCAVAGAGTSAWSHWASLALGQHLSRSSLCWLRMQFLNHFPVNNQGQRPMQTQVKGRTTGIPTTLASQELPDDTVD